MVASVEAWVVWNEASATPTDSVTASPLAGDRQMNSHDRRAREAAKAEQHLRHVQTASCPPGGQPCIED